MNILVSLVVELAPALRLTEFLGRIMKQILRVILITLAISPVSAFAYIDPGSGSVIMSAIIGFFVATAMVVKTYWYKLKSVFTGKKTTFVEEDPQEKAENG